MTAEMFNKVARSLEGLENGAVSFYNPDTKQNQQSMTPDVDICYGSYFSTLESYANNFKLHSSQCDNCNANCNVKCNKCQKCNQTNCTDCNNCDNCDSCQSDTPKYSTSYC